MIITVSAFNGYKTVVLQTNEKDEVIVYADTWDYLHTKENLLKFLDKVEEFNKKQEKKNE